MIPVETAVRAYVQLERKSVRRRGFRPGWRSQRFGERVLVFDTETTTDTTQRLLFGIFQLYEERSLAREGIFPGESLTPAEVESIQAYGVSRGLTVISRSEFVEDVFYPEVYALGSLCVGFNLKFDISRIAMRARCGRGRNRRRFTFVLTRRFRWPEVQVEPVSSRAAFVRFVPKKHLANWEKPFFRGRFLDLATLTKALTGETASLARAARRFGTIHRKSRTGTLGRITVETLEYGRNDVTVTWELFEKLQEEYLKHPFATIENERDQLSGTVPYTRILSSASVAKATLRRLGFKPLMAP